jgi:hypothetical protein
MQTDTGTDMKPTPKTSRKKREVTTRAVAVRPAPTLDQQIVMAAADPHVDVGKMKALTELRTQMRAEDAKEAFNIALGEAQAEMRPIEADANNPSTRSKYATLYQVDSKLRPVYSKHGLSISFNTADCPLPEHTRVLAYVSRGLHIREYQIDIAVDTKGAKGNDVMTKTHASGSALSYGKRYLLLMIFNVTIADPGRRSDDDGNAAGGAATITQKQVKEVQAALKDAGADEEKFCAAFSIPSIAMLRPADLTAGLARIAAFKKAKQARESDFPGDRP